MRKVLSKIIYHLYPYIPPFFWHFRNWLKSFEYREITRLKKNQRYISGKTELIGKPIIFPDAASFLSQYNELFIKQIYKFSSTSSTPFIIDCGANIGMSILYFKSQFPDAEIYAFEPDKEVYKYLSSNVKNEGVTLFNKGVWDKEMTLTFHSEGADSGKIIDENTSSDKITSIETLRLKDFLNRNVDFLKIDIEGAEYTVLKDCEDSLKMVKNIFVEYHSFVNQEQYLGEIINILKKAGFRIHMHQDICSPSPFHKITPYNEIEFSSNVFGFR
jgi:FkbM family methyltransferase